MNEPDWYIARERLGPILIQFEDLTPSQRKKLFSMIEEVYCSGCGKETRYCSCLIDDRW